MDQQSRQKEQQRRHQLAIDAWLPRVQQGIDKRPAKAEHIELSPKGEKKDEDKDRGAGV